jgi:hypothetical protein
MGDWGNFRESVSQNSEMKDHGLQESTDFNPKKEIEPQISQMDTDDEEVVEDLSKPVWWMPQFEKSESSVVEF